MPPFIDVAAANEAPVTDAKQYRSTASRVAAPRRAAAPSRGLLPRRSVTPTVLPFTGIRDPSMWPSAPAGPVYATDGTTHSDSPNSDRVPKPDSGADGAPPSW